MALALLIALSFREQLATFEKQAEHPTRAKRQIASYARRWTNNKVYYYFDTNITAAHRAFVKKELNYVQARTCLVFIENATAKNRIKVFYGSGCWSYVGMLSAEQELSLASGCMSVGIVTHEFMHALGSMHMHMRDDRDTYLNVNMTAMSDSDRNNYVKATESINNTPYEYASRMQYASNIYMTAKQARYQRTMGSRTVSFYDILMINRFYQCFAACAGKGVTGKCKNKGVPNPKNCNVCICPYGYGGALCNQRPAACGGTLAAATTWKARNVTIGNATVTTMRDTYTVCSDWISAPAGKTIQDSSDSSERCYMQQWLPVQLN
ncbi:astacin [Cooperia oncophora]